MASNGSTALPLHPKDAPNSLSSAKKSGVPKFGHYQNEVYINGILKNQLTTVTTDPNKLEAQAKQHLGERSYNYVAGGAGERATMDANRLAFRQWKVRRAKPVPWYTESTH
jgi:hypothetical protein